MFGILKRKVSANENIQTLIDNIKILMGKKTVEEILDSYPAQKLQTQETFHLKLIKHKFVRDVGRYREMTLNNNKFQFMIDDLSKSFDRFSLIEINDFLEFYRKTLIFGASDILTPDQYKNLLKALSKVSFSHNTFAPIYAQTYLNFSTLNIENPKIKNMKFKTINSLRCSDVHQILHSMILCPYYFNEVIISEICKNFHLITGNHSSVENITKVINQYIMVCDINNLAPNEKLLNEFRSFINNLFNKSESNLLRVFKYYKKGRTDIFLEPYKERFKKFLKLNLNKEDLFIENTKCILCVFPDDNEMIELLKSKLRNDYLQSYLTSQEFYKFRLLDYFVYGKVFDYDICEALTINFQYDARITKLYIELMICTNYINQQLGPKKLFFPHTEDLAHLLQDIDIENILHLLHKSRTFDGAPAVSQSDFLTITSSIKSRMQKSPNISRVAQGLIRYSNTLYNTNLTL